MAIFVYFFLVLVIYFLFKLSKPDSSLIEHKIKFLICFRKKNVMSNKLRVKVDILEIDFLIEMGAVASTATVRRFKEKINQK